MSAGILLKLPRKESWGVINQCNKDLISEHESEYLKYREYADKKWLCSPSDTLLNCISNLQDINCIMLKENLENNNLKEFIKTIILMHVDFNFVQCTTYYEALIDFFYKNIL